MGPSSSGLPAAIGVGRIFAITALVEAGTWAGLLVGMFLKYVTQTTESVVQLFGPLHGLAFLVYLAVTIAAAVRFRWPWHATLVAIAASIPPLTTIFAEAWLYRTGRLRIAVDIAYKNPAAVSSRGYGPAGKSKL